MQGFTNTADRNGTISYIEECGCQTEAAEADCVKTAMAFARQCHQGQTRLGRDGKVPYYDCLLYTSPSPRDVEESRMPSSA